MERIADPASSLPHMLPSEAQFAAAAHALGVTADDALVSASSGECHSLSCIACTRCTCPRVASVRAMLRSSFAPAVRV